MSFLVLRRGGDAIWESIGPSLAEMSADDAEAKARALANNHPVQEYAVAEVRKIFAMERQVVGRDVGEHNISPNAQPIQNLRNVVGQS